MAEIIKPTKARLDELMKLWIAQGEFHRNLDSVYYKEASSDTEYLLNAIEKSRPNILAVEEKGSLVGFVTFDSGEADYFDTNIRDYIEILELFVLPEFRGKGFGRMLMDEVEKFCKEKGLKWVKLQCSTKNPAALKFYEKMNYEDRQRQLFKEIK